jgi:tRNA 2-selenouridine synthase
MIPSLGIDEFLHKAGHWPVIDVRSPSEFSKGHIPGAVNICLFNDKERALVGTLYNKNSREIALNKGIELISPRLDHLVKMSFEAAPGKNALIHCWRGGERSASFAFLLQTAGMTVNTLQGGYQSYRQKVVNAFNEPAPLIILGGMTGSGKTRYLKMLAGKGFQVIDLEEMAHHKGSVFGGIGQKDQPTTEQFQNDLFHKWTRLDYTKVILIEDENMDIGAVKLPVNLYHRIRNAPLINLQSKNTVRAVQLAKEYNHNNDDELIAATRRIERRLGNEHMKNILEAIAQKDYLKAASALLVYYDKSYLASIAKRSASLVFPVPVHEDQEEKNLRNIMKSTNDILQSFYKINSLYE